jgi:hypothetical protein
MKGLLVVLCAMVTAAAVLAGGCAFFFTGVAAVGPEAELLVITVPLMVVAAAVVAVNVALIVAIRAGTAGRSTLFAIVGLVDLLLGSGLLVAGIGNGDPVAPLMLAVPLVVKGILTLRLPAKPPA